MTEFWQVGVVLVVRCLRGSRDKWLLELGLQSLSTYGLLKTMGRSEIRSMIDQLETDGYVLTKQEYQTVRLTAKASEVLFHGKPVRILTPNDCFGFDKCTQTR